MTNVAAALAYYGFLAIPSALLVTLGVFGIVADPSDVPQLLTRLDGIVPQSAIALLEDSLVRTAGAPSGRHRDDRRRHADRRLDADGRDDDADVGAQHRVRPRGEPRLRPPAAECAEDARPGRRRRSCSPSGCWCSARSCRAGWATPSASPRSSAGCGGSPSGRSCSPPCSARSPGSSTSGRPASRSAAGWSRSAAWWPSRSGSPRRAASRSTRAGSARTTSPGDRCRP